MINEGEWSYDGFRYYTRDSPSTGYGTGLGSSFGDPLFWMNADPNAEIIPDPALKIEDPLPIVGLVAIALLL